MNDKTRRILQTVFACIAIISAVITLALTPVGKKLLKSGETSEITATSPVTTDEVQTTAVEASAENSEERSTAVSIPTPTEPTTDPYKNYNIFIDFKTFDYTVEKGVTTLVAKENSKVTMTVTPLKKDYSEHCDELLDSYASMGDSATLNIENINSGYRSQTGDKDDDIITTVYCVDDGKGGCIEIKYQTPVSAEGYARRFEILLTMFNVL